MIMENNKQQNSQLPQNREQLLQALQPLTTVPLDQLSDEQISQLLARLNALKEQKRAAKEGPSEPAAQPQNPILTPVRVPASQAPVPDAQSIDEPSHASVLRKADEAEAALNMDIDDNADVTAHDDSDTVIFPDPSCFDHLGDAPKNGVDYDPSLSTYVGDAADNPADEAPAPTVAEPSADTEDDNTDEATVAMYRDLVRKHRRQRNLLITLIVICSVFVLLFAGIGAYLTLYKPTVDDAPPPFWSGEVQTDSNGVEIFVPSGDGADGNDVVQGAAPVITDHYTRRKDVYNFLVLGVDRAANLSDVIMVISYDISKQTIDVLSLPRDTYINVGSTYHKLNAYFAASYNRSASRGTERYRDAIQSMASFIENSLCIRLDRYICMDTAGFREIIDAIGGVDMDVPFDMHYEDPDQQLYIHLDAGFQHLDGAKAEQFVRFRSGYLEGDIGRISAQRLFLTALANQVKSSLDLSSAVSIAKTTLAYVTTDLTVAEIGYFAKNAFSVDMDNVTFTTLPGGAAFNPDTGASYYVMYAENVRKIVNEHFNVYDRDISREVFLANSKKFTNEASYISSVFMTEIKNNGTVSADEIQADVPNIPHK